jgi:hypothetical protein
LGNWNLVSYALVEGVQDETFDWKKNTETLKKLVIKRIENWDIRMVKKLIDLFPKIVKTSCVGKIPECYMADDENCTWMVCFN